MASEPDFAAVNPLEELSKSLEHRIKNTSYNSRVLSALILTFTCFTLFFIATRPDSVLACLTLIAIASLGLHACFIGDQQLLGYYAILLGAWIIFWSMYALFSVFFLVSIRDIAESRCYESDVNIGPDGDFTTQDKCLEVVSSRYIILAGCTLGITFAVFALCEYQVVHFYRCLKKLLIEEEALSESE